MKNRKRTGVWFAALAFGSICAVYLCANLLAIAYAVYSELEYQKKDREPFEKIKTGMTEEEVRNLLEDRRPSGAYPGVDDYYVDGYSHKERAITGKCLIYFGDYDSICYVYFDENGRVEDVYIGSS